MAPLAFPTGRWWIVGLTFLGIFVGPYFYLYYYRSTITHGPAIALRVLWLRILGGAVCLFAITALRLAAKRFRFSVLDMVEVGLSTAVLAVLLREMLLLGQTLSG